VTADEVAKDIVDAAIKVHRALGPGLLESACQFAWHTNYEEHRVERRHPPNDLRHSRESGNPALVGNYWIPAPAYYPPG